MNTGAEKGDFTGLFVGSEQSRFCKYYNFVSSEVRAHKIVKLSLLQQRTHTDRGNIIITISYEVWRQSTYLYCNFLFQFSDALALKRSMCAAAQVQADHADDDQCQRNELPGSYRLFEPEDADARN